jgi:hypothetical protein
VDAEAEDIAGRIKGLVIRLGDRLSATDQDLVIELIDCLNLVQTRR